MRFGLISDTHNLLRPQVFELLRGVDRILHAGDIGSPDLLVALEAIAPVTAVFGNTDGWDIRHRVREEQWLELGEDRRLLLVHGHQLASPSPDGLRQAWPDADVIVYGHTHRQLVDGGTRGVALTVNPGAAGAARFGLKPCVAIMDVGEQIDVRLLEIDARR